MGAKTGIEWTDASWNPIRARLTEQGRVRVIAEGRAVFAEQSADGAFKMPGIGSHCEHVTEACRHCYAEAINLRIGTGLPFKPAHLDSGDVEIFLDPRALVAPLRWKRARRIFLTSTSDLAARFVTDDMLDRMFAVMALTPWHTYQVLSKRPERVRTYLEAVGKDHTEFGLFRWADAGGRLCEDGDGGFAQIMNSGWPLPNVWIGTSVHDQNSADVFIPELMQTPATVRFLSIEPLLGPITLEPKADATYRRLSQWYGPNGFDETGSQPVKDRMGGLIWHLDWVIVGGESGPTARPMDPALVHSLRDQCVAAKIPFFFKQWGAWTPEPISLADDAILHRFDSGFTMTRTTKKKAGRTLTGRTHDDFPTTEFQRAGEAHNAESTT